jgi:hypothetical protein
MSFSTICIPSVKPDWLPFSFVILNTRINSMIYLSPGVRERDKTVLVACMGGIKNAYLILFNQLNRIDN